MALLKRKTTTELEPQKFQPGETVIILRPHLHSGCIGEVVFFLNGMHRIKIPTKNNRAIEKFWQADVPGSQLEGWI